MNETLKGLVLGGVLVLPTIVTAQDAALVPASEVAPADTMSAPVEAAPAAPADEAVTAESAAPLETVPVDVAAPEDAAEPAERSSGSRLVEEIVVTAQKRTENIQEVPIAIAAFSPDKLDAVGIESAQDLERATPGLTITNAAGFSVAYLRGIGTDAFLPGADPSVPFYLDGVALLGSQGSSDTLGRIERVEVLKGPQGTLFGRNATGGAISIVTPDPGPDPEGDVKIQYGKYNDLRGIGYLNLPLVEGLAGSVSAFYSARDNYYKNDSTGGIIDIYSRGARGKLRWDATETLAFTATASYAEASNNAGLSFENTRVAPVFSAVLPQDPKADRRVNYDELAGAQTNARLYSGIVDWKLPWVDAKLILSDQKQNAPFVRSDFDKSELRLVSFVSLKQLSKQKTAELQFLSNDETPGSDRFKWVGGFYFIESSGGFDPLQLTIGPGLATLLAGSPELASALSPLVTQLGDLITAAGLPAPTGGAAVRANSHGVLAGKAISTYFQGTYTIFDPLDLTLGLRYQEEERDLKRASLAVANDDGSETPIRQDNTPTLRAYQLSPRVALQYRLNDVSQVYTSWSRAYKSPTYNTVNFFDTPEAVEEEQVDSYELGAKSDLFDGNLRLNGAAFFIEQKNLLTGFVALASGGVVTYDNAGDSEVKGVEAEFTLTPMPDSNPGLAISGSGTYLKARYTDYKDGRGFDEDTGLAFGEGSTTQLPARDFTGNKTVRSPKVTFALAVSQAIQVTGGSIEVGADVFSNSGFFFLPQNSELYKRDEYQLYNARVSYFYDAWGAQFTLFGENVTDETYNEVVFVDDFGRNQVLNNPRTYGMRVQFAF